MKEILRNIGETMLEILTMLVYTAIATVCICIAFIVWILIMAIIAPVAVCVMTVTSRESIMDNFYELYALMFQGIKFILNYALDDAH